ncbi:MAG: hypothetical protein M1830_006235 [Pleopsidium flavum]|nr:MAG: hypothetical protein M1830_006235 [Pleopsidium flavum]
MAKASNEEQFKFLISCIRYSNNGKVDFGEVARECGIVTKGAAAKRYERMMKAHGIHPTSPTVRDTPAPTKGKDSAKSLALKKRKLDQFCDPASGATDDDEGLAKVKDEVGAVFVKDEAATVGQEYSGGEIMQFPVLQGGCMGAGSSNGYRSDDGNVFNDFIQSGAFGQSLVESPSTFHASRDPSLYENSLAAQSSGSAKATDEIILIAD